MTLSRSNKATANPKGEGGRGRLAVVCVLWKGDFRRRAYDEGWVMKLQRMVERNLAIPHEFVCLTNTKATKPLRREGVVVIPLKEGLPGWWSKLEIFSPYLRGLYDRFLYLDLDTLVVRDLAPIVDYESPFALRSNFNRPKTTITPNSKGEVTRYNSSVMVFDGLSEAARELWYGFEYSKAHSYFRGDQDYIGYKCPNLDLLPSNWIQKLRYLPKKRPDGEVKVILSMPHKNDKAASRYPWVRSVWK